MSTGILQSYPFSDGSTWTFDNTKIEFQSLEARLKLLESALQFEEQFTSSTGHTFDSNLAEFVSSLVRQKNQSPTNSILGAKYNVDGLFDASWANSGSVTATLNGSPTVSGGFLVCTDPTTAAQKGLYYNITNDGQASIKVIYKPDYDDDPSGNINVVGIQEPTGNNNRIILTHSPSGDNFRVTITNSTGTNVYLATTIGASSLGLVSGTEYELLFLWDNVAGLVRLFIDGNLHGTLTPSPWTFNANAARLYVGAMPSIYNLADASYKDLVYFSDIQESASYTPGYSLPDKLYLTSNVTIPVFSDPLPGSIVSLSALTVVEVGSARYSINLNGGGFLYFDGNNWVSSDGTYAQANVSGTFNSNIALLAASGVTSIILRIHFTDTNTLTSVDNLIVDYTGQTGYATDNPTLQPNSNLNTNQICKLVATIVKSGSDDIRISLLADGVEKYYTAGAWVNNSSTFANTNAASELTEAVVQQLTIVSYANIKLWFHSDDGTTTPSLSLLELEFILNPADAEEPRIAVYGELNRADSALFASVSITAKPEFHSCVIGKNIQVPEEEVPATINVNDGTWSINLYPSNRLEGNPRYIFKETIGRNITVDTKNVIGLVQTQYESLT